MPVLPKIVLPAKLEHLQDFLTFVSQWAREQGVTDKRISEIELATEEALVNIFHYAYKDRDGQVEVGCRVDPEQRLIIEIKDSGLPYNPLARFDPDLSSDVSEREIGGLGVYFIKTLIDEVRYRRQDNKNVLTLVIYKK